MKHMSKSAACIGGGGDGNKKSKYTLHKHKYGCMTQMQKYSVLAAD